VVSCFVTMRLIPRQGNTYRGPNGLPFTAYVNSQAYQQPPRDTDVGQMFTIPVGPFLFCVGPGLQRDGSGGLCVSPNLISRKPAGLSDRKAVVKRHCGGLDRERDVKDDGRSFTSVFARMAHAGRQVPSFVSIFPKWICRHFAGEKK
jgi:hypothetical protein